MTAEPTTVPECPARAIVWLFGRMLGLARGRKVRYEIMRKRGFLLMRLYYRFDVFSLRDCRCDSNALRVQMSSLVSLDVMPVTRL